jgi:hypothetical protein
MHGAEVEGSGPTLDRDRVASEDLSAEEWRNLADSVQRFGAADR